MASDKQKPAPPPGTGAVPDGASTGGFIDETLVDFETIVSADGGALDLDSDDALIVVHADSTPVGSERHVMGPEIARGGMGSIRVVRDRAIRRRVAMKVLRTKHHGSSEQISRLVHEAQVTGQLEHPNIVPVHEMGRDEDGLPYYTMKLIAGTSLKSILDKIRDGDAETIRNFPLNRLVTILTRAADAVAFAHSRGVIHRDLKPDNIMVGDFGEVLVLDWGLAKILEPGNETEAEHQRRMEEFQSAVEAANSAARKWITTPDNVISDRHDDPDTHHTLEGQTLGTPAYMAPEQALGQVELLNQRTDIYAMGAILYHILALRPPVEGGSVVEVLSQVTDGAIADLSTLSRTQNVAPGKSSVAYRAPELPHLPNRRIPPSLAAITMKALSRNPDERYQSVQEMQADIDAYQLGYATDAEGASPLRHLLLMLRRHKAATAVGVVALIIMAFTVYGAFVGVMDQRDSAQIEALRFEQALEARKQEAQRRRTISQEAAPLFLERADRHFEAGDWAQAAEAVSSALALDSDLSPAHFRRGMLRLQAEDFDGARSDFVVAGNDNDYEHAANARLLAAIVNRLASASLPGSNEKVEAGVALRHVLLEIDDGRWGRVVYGDE